MCWLCECSPVDIGGRVTRRHAIITELLRNWNDVEATLNAKTGLPGDGNTLTLMNPAWNHSYRELERVCRHMRHRKPRLWWHVRERYLATQTIMAECKVRNGRIMLPPRCELAAGQAQVGAKTVRVQVRTWHPCVELAQVERGIDWISRHFQGEPYLPEELADRVAA